MLHVMAHSALAPGPTSKQVAENTAAIRKARRLQQRDLSDRLREIGRPMLPSVISKIERGERRIDVDDLVALAVALRISPLSLLLPCSPHPSDGIEMTGSGAVTAHAAWAWADGQRPLTISATDPEGDAIRFQLDSRPAWARRPR